MSMKKPFAEPEYTQVSNAALDHVMRRASPGVWKIICAILRKTKGFHKVEDELSYTQFEDMTGMGREAVAKAVKEALEARYILRRKNGISFVYGINPEYEIDTSSEIEPVRKSNQTSSEIEPIPVRNPNTQKKERNSKEIAPNGARPAPEKKGDLFDGILFYSEKGKGKPDFSFLSESLLPLAEAFCVAGGPHPIKSLQSLWRKELTEWALLGYTPQRVAVAVRKHLTQPDAIIKSPKSVSYLMLSSETPPERTYTEEY